METIFCCCLVKPHWYTLCCIPHKKNAKREDDGKDTTDHCCHCCKKGYRITFRKVRIDKSSQPDSATKKYRKINNKTNDVFVGIHEGKKLVTKPIYQLQFPEIKTEYNVLFNIY